MASSATPNPEVQVPPVAGTPPAVQQPDPALARLEAQVRQSHAEVQNLKRQVMAPQQPVAQNQQPPDATQLKAEFFKNPLEFTAAIAQRAVYEANRQAGAASYDTLVSLARDKARAQDPVAFDKYSNEIDILVASTTEPQFRQNVNVWNNAFKLVKADHIEEILEARKAGSGAPEGTPGNPGQAPAVHISREGGPATPNRQAPASAKSTLTPDEKAVARGLGISDEQYLGGKTMIENQNAKGQSSWDKYITTNSREKRRADRAKRNAAASAK